MQGNAKKDKKLRKQRKEDKKARRRAAEEMSEAERVVVERGKGQSSASQSYTYVDFEKTSESYDRMVNEKGHKSRNKEGEVLRLV